MNVKSTLSRLRSGELHYVFGRFRAVRMSYSRIRRLRQTGFRVSAKISGGQTLFPDIDVAQAVKTIRDDAVFLGIRLPATIVREIDTFCRSTPLFARDDPDGPTFLHHDVIRGRTPDGRPTPTGSIRDPMSCGAVRAIVEDPVLRAIARNYLGYEPHTDAPILYWSLASDFTDEERRSLQQVAIDYHYDVGGFNFVYASFYILDTRPIFRRTRDDAEVARPQVIADALRIDDRKRIPGSPTIRPRERAGDRRPGRQRVHPRCRLLPPRVSADSRGPANASNPVPLERCLEGLGSYH